MNIIQLLSKKITLYVKIIVIVAAKTKKLAPPISIVYWHIKSTKKDTMTSNLQRR